MTFSELGVGYPIRINTFVLAWHQVLPAKPQVRGLSTLICLIGTILRVDKIPGRIAGKPLRTAPGYRYKSAARSRFPTSNK